jgi:hypothetical protein
MFKIEVTKLNNEVEHIYNMNKLDDDFLQFLPRNYGVQKEAVVAYAMPDDWKYELEAYLKLGPQYKLDLSQAGKLVVVTVTEEVDEETEAVEEIVTLVKEYVGTLIEWPYDDKGSFLVEKQKVV